MKNLDKKIKDFVKIYKKITNITLKQNISHLKFDNNNHNITSKLIIIVILNIIKVLRNYQNMIIDIKRKQREK